MSNAIGDIENKIFYDRKCPCCGGKFRFSIVDSIETMDLRLVGECRNFGDDCDIGYLNTRWEPDNPTLSMRAIVRQYEKICYDYLKEDRWRKKYHEFNKKKRKLIGKKLEVRL